MRQRLTPAWVTDTGLWVWNRGRSPGVLGPALALQQAAGVPVSVFWHWWHGCPYDAGFPEYLPPREGADPFRQAVAAAQTTRPARIVYMNQRLWGMTTRSWTEEGAEQFAVKNADGTVTPEVYNTFMKVPCASMCMGTDFWRDKYAQRGRGGSLRIWEWTASTWTRPVPVSPVMTPHMVTRWAAVPGGWKVFSTGE